MAFLQRLRAGLFALLCVVLAACSAPQLTASWRDPGYSGAPLGKVMVLGISQSDVDRRLFEDSFSAALREAGVDAQISYPLLPESGPIEQVRIRKALAKTGAEGVLVTRLINVEQRIEVTPGTGIGPMSQGFYGWYGTAWAALPPSIETYKVLTLESTLWDMQTGRVIWSGTSDTLEVSDIAKFSRELAKVLITRMRADRVL
ncbi:hypothetical protein QU487_20975 [Crenobacter sp. SG2305]|uniref:hypothetical protein n=1 Tax=Crenobacter oryzisoli TaxID=3056844 RepID=UPI0025AB49A5|nr:hypothetical protein [Crenobacter sp. SG2305]MDN0085185.1 hypothetical protein [Crenobacter sp. SG2305]